MSLHAHIYRLAVPASLCISVRASSEAEAKKKAIEMLHGTYLENLGIKVDIGNNGEGDGMLYFGPEIDDGKPKGITVENVQEVS